MHLFLSRNFPTNTVFNDDEGTERYRVETPWKPSQNITTVSRINHNSSSKSDSSPLDSKLGEVAQIRWSWLGSSRLTFGTIECDIKEYIPSEGFLGRYRTFTAPDGHSYRWTMRFHTPVLHTNDESNTPVAAFRRPRPGLFGKARKASLEIFHAGEHIVDAIVVTFVYVEKLRRDVDPASDSVGI